MDLEARIAVLESNMEHYADNVHKLSMDIKELANFVKEHMEKEERDREALLEALYEIKTTQAKMKSFWAGITFAISMLWALVLGVGYFFMKGYQ